MSKMIRREKNITGLLTYSSLKAVRTVIDELITEYGEDALLDVELRYMPYDPDPDASVILSYQTPETEEEKKQRIERIKKSKEERKKQYESLKKEFENS